MKRIRRFILMILSIVAPAMLATTAYSAPIDATRFYTGIQLGDSIVGGLLGMQFSRAWSIEARYDYVDTINEPNNKTEASCVGLTGLGMYPVKFGKMSPFFIFLKAGYEETTTETTKTDPGIPGFPATTTITTKVRKRTVVGAGVQHDFSRNVSGRIGLNAIGSDQSAYLTAIYRF